MPKQYIIMIIFKLGVNRPKREKVKIVYIKYDDDDDDLHLNVTNLLKFVNFAPQFLIQKMVLICTRFANIGSCCTAVVKKIFILTKFR